MTISSPLKWVGGKQTILSGILPKIGNPNTFVEPFIGSATVSLNVCANKYIMNDMNYDLINLYNHLISNSKGLIELSSKNFENMNKDMFYELRNSFNSASYNSLERAALFLVMNKFAFNGVCRYNKNGIFNVPYGQSSKKGFPLKEISSFVNHFSSKEHVLLHGDFNNPMLYQNLTEGDVVYFDPPYLPADEFDSNFTAYTKEDFSSEQHRQIVEICKSLRGKGVLCLVSNHSTKRTEELYNDADELVIIPKKRLISAKKETRMIINEILAVYGEPTSTGKLF